MTWLKDVGCYRISFGLEHGNEEFRRKRLLRRMTNEFILQQSQIVSKVGIPYTLNNIIGLPYETRELFFETVKLNKQIATFDSLSVNVFVPYHGTPMREWAIQEGWLDPDRQTTSVISESILEMPPPYLSAKEIMSLQRVFPLYVSMPESRYPEIKRAETRDAEGDKIFEALSEEFYIAKYGEDEASRKLTFAGSFRPVFASLQ